MREDYFFDIHLINEVFTDVVLGSGLKGRGIIKTKDSLSQFLCRSSRDWLVLLSCQKDAKPCRCTGSTRRFTIPAIVDPLRRHLSGM